MEELEEKEQKVHLSEYFRILYRGRWIILVSFLAVVISTVYYTFNQRPIYEAVTTILIEEAGTMGKTLFGVDAFLTRQTRISNQVQILKSRTLAEHVVRSMQKSPYWDKLELLGFNPELGEMSPKPPEFDNIVASLRGRIEVSPIRDTDLIELKVTANTAFESAFLANETAQEYYRQNREFGKGEISAVIKLLESELDQIGDDLTASEETLKLYKETEKVAALPVETQQLVEQVAQFQSLYEAAKTDLKTSMTRLNYLKEQLSARKSTLVEDVSKITNPLIIELQGEIARKQTLIATIMGQGMPGWEEKAASIEREIDQIKQKLIEEITKIADSELASVDPLRTSQEIVNKIFEVEVDKHSLEARVNALEKVVDRFDQQLEALPQKSLELARLARNAKLNEKIYIMLREKHQESQITEAGVIGNVRIIDSAKPPKFPIKPRKKLNLILATMVGLGLGIGISFLIEYFDDTVKTIEDVERLGLTMLGSIPSIDPEEIERKMKSEGRVLSKAERIRVENKLITHFSPKSPISEAYRSFRTNIQFSNLEKKRKILLVSSSSSKEGKSTTVANLAVTLAQMGSRTLIVDSDMRRPVQHVLFSLDRAYGLTDVLLGNLSLEGAIKGTDIDNLDVLTCGDIPPNPSEMLASEKMQNLMDELKAMYDIILMDSPPIIAVTDAAILSTRVDGMLLVVASGEANKKEIERALNLLSNVNTQVLGVILNGIDIKRIYGSYYYYYHYYQYYYYYGRDKEKKGRFIRRKMRKKKRSEPASVMKGDKEIV